MGVLNRSFFVREAQPVVDELRRQMEEEADLLQQAVNRLHLIYKIDGDGEHREDVNEILTALENQSMRMSKLVEDL